MIINVNYASHFSRPQQMGFQTMNRSRARQKVMVSAGDTYFNGAQARNDTWPDILGF